MAENECNKPDNVLYVNTYTADEACCGCGGGDVVNGQCMDKQLPAHGCSGMAACLNTIGAYTCECNSGSMGDGKICLDVDECGSSYAWFV